MSCRAARCRAAAFSGGGARTDSPVAGVAAGEWQDEQTGGVRLGLVSASRGDANLHNADSGGIAQDGGEAAARRDVGPAHAKDTRPGEEGTPSDFVDDPVARAGVLGEGHGT